MAFTQFIGGDAWNNVQAMSGRPAQRMFGRFDQTRFRSLASQPLFSEYCSLAARNFTVSAKS